MFVTAYGVPLCDCSSDVCSSYLIAIFAIGSTVYFIAIFAIGSTVYFIAIFAIGSPDYHFVFYMISLIIFGGV
jgi:hypothetical protein